MSDLTINITDLKTKVEKLVNLHQQLKKDKEEVVVENKKLLKTIEEQKLTIESLQKNNQHETIHQSRRSLDGSPSGTFYLSDQQR